MRGNTHRVHVALDGVMLPAQNTTNTSGVTIPRQRRIVAMRHCSVLVESRHGDEEECCIAAATHLPQIDVIAHLLVEEREIVVVPQSHFIHLVGPKKASQL